MTDSIIFSSSDVCERLAERMLRHMDEQPETAMVRFGTLLRPILNTIYNSKLKRGSVKAHVQKFVDGLSKEPAVIEADFVDLTPKKLSTQESAQFRFVAMSTTESRQWVSFEAAEAMVTRRTVETSLGTTGVRIHRHALSRYMNRERKPLDELFRSIMDAIVMSPTLATIIVTSRKQHEIAVPLGTGMLFGRIRTSSNPITHFGAVYDSRAGEPTQRVIETTPLVENCKVKVEFLTYVDANALLENREALHRDLSRVYAEYGSVLRMLFEGLTFPNTQMRKRDYPAVVEKLTQCLAELREIVQSPTWAEFANTGHRA